MMIIKSIGAISTGKVLGCIYAVMGLFIGGIFSLIALTGAAVGGGPNAPPPGVMVLLGGGAVIMLPIFYGVIGFFGGIITALHLQRNGVRRWRHRD